MTSTIVQPPDLLINSDGQPSMGIFSGSVRHINGLCADYRNGLGVPVPPWKKRFHYKQFQYFGIISDDFLIGCALADTAWLGLAFIYVFDVRQQTLKEYTWRSPLARAMTLSESPVSGDSRFQQRGIDIHLSYCQEGDTLVKGITIDCPEMQVKATMRESIPFTPMSLCTRAGINGWVYANKVAGLPVEGSLRIGQQQHDLGMLGACGHHDFSAGFMRRETFWNWACFSGLQQEHLVGINLSCGVNETSHTENCIWLDQQLIKVDNVRFDYNRDDLMAPWTISSQDGQIDLRFTPRGNHQEKINLLLFASNFNQLFGTFDGMLRPIGQPAITIRNLNGFVEEQYAKW